MSNSLHITSSTRQSLASQKSEYKQEISVRREKKRKERKKKRDDTLLLDLPSTKPSTVEGRSTVSNHLAAQALKGFLAETRPEKDTTAAIRENNGEASKALSNPQEAIAIAQDQAPVHLTTEAVLNGARKPARDRIVEAFRRTYSLVGNEERRRGYTSMYSEDINMETIQEKQEMSNCLKAFDANDGAEDQKQDVAPIADAMGISSGVMKDLLEQTRVSGGHGTGIGVIGSHAFFSNLKDCQTMLADSCDMPIPVMDINLDFKLRRLNEVEFKYRLGEYIVDFDPDVSPISVQYPARVWNTLIHAMKEEDQPVMSWKFSLISGEGEYVTPITCQFSMIKRSAGVRSEDCRTWIGQPCHNKVDASNSALKRCMKDDGLAWLLDDENKEAK